MSSLDRPSPWQVCRKQQNGSIMLDKAHMLTAYMQHATQRLYALMLTCENIAPSRGAAPVPVEQEAAKSLAGATRRLQESSGRFAKLRQEGLHLLHQASLKFSRQRQQQKIRSNASSNSNNSRREQCQEQQDCSKKGSSRQQKL